MQLAVIKSEQAKMTFFNSRTGCFVNKSGSLTIFEHIFKILIMPTAFNSA